PEKLNERVQGMAGQIANRTIGYVSGLLGVVVEVFFVIFTMYYLFRDGDRLSLALSSALPLAERNSEEIFLRTREVISASVYGVLVIATIQGALGGLAFWALGLPSALLWGVVMIFMSMIPMAGAFVVWVPAAIYLVATGQWGKAIVLAAWGTIIIGTVDNFLRPKLVGEKTRLHELLIFFSVLGGLQFFGVLGLVLGPVVVAITLALLDVFRHATPTTADETPQANAPLERQEATDTLLEEQQQLRNVPSEETSHENP
ncbi:MAG TPA: AI-2E family transporter, partial [Pyrinomonadaceae bacterium]|nr:AI-2E family transporter [Pyrinomonadaceae bacterium]